MFGIGKRTSKDSYFEELARSEFDPALVERVREAIETTGEWKESEEWRMASWTDMSIKPVESKGRQWFEVRVACDHEFVCHAPTIERATEFLWLYRNMIIALFYQMGWPSWISKTTHPGSEP